MHVFMRYGKGEIDLGEMPILPLPEDRVCFDVPEELIQDNKQEQLTVGRRYFEQRATWHSTFDDLDPCVREKIPLTGRPAWVCVLVSQETR